VPELTDVRIAPDCCIDELAGFFLHFANIDGESEIAVIVEFYRTARGLRERHLPNRGDQFIRIDIAASRLQGRFEDLPIDIERGCIESDRNIGAEILLHRSDEPAVCIRV